MQIYSSKTFVLFLLPTFPVLQVDLTIFIHVVNGECILLSPHVLDKDGIYLLGVHLDISVLELHEFTASNQGKPGQISGPSLPYLVQIIQAIEANARNLRHLMTCFFTSSLIDRKSVV